jgi:hypothetical protein
MHTSLGQGSFPKLLVHVGAEPQLAKVLRGADKGLSLQ